MTLDRVLELISAAAEKTGFSKKDTEAMLNAVLDTIVSALEEGEKVQLVASAPSKSSSAPPASAATPRRRKPLRSPRPRPLPSSPARPSRTPWQNKAMRLDKYLKVSRLIKRRTVANEACDAERVSVNGRVQRASYDVKVGDRISIRFGEKTVTVEVLAVSETAGKADAGALYREVAAADS